MIVSGMVGLIGLLFVAYLSAKLVARELGSAAM